MSLRGVQALLVLGLLLFGTASAQEVQPVGVELTAGSLEVQMDGALDFGVRLLTGREQEVSAVSAPAVRVVDARGSGLGWYLSFSLTDLTTTQGALLPADSVSFLASGGSVAALDGLPVGAGGPAETGLSGPLEQPLRVLESAPESGMGTYRWLPNADRFSLRIPATALAGSYRGTLTVTVTSGP